MPDVSKRSSMSRLIRSGRIERRFAVRRSRSFLSSSSRLRPVAGGYVGQDFGEVSRGAVLDWDSDGRWQPVPLTDPRTGAADETYRTDRINEKAEPQTAN